VQYLQTRAWWWICSLQNGQICVRMPISISSRPVCCQAGGAVLFRFRLFILAGGATHKILLVSAGSPLLR
jgi:hypothetical protein